MPRTSTTAATLQRFDAPAVSSRLLTRERVLRALEATGPSAVLCVGAPGGYGKTTALAQWSKRDPRPVVWLRVRPESADPQWLAQSLVDALCEHEIVAGPVALPGAVNAVSWHQVTLPTLEKVLSGAWDPVLVIVDDSQEMVGTEWEGLLESVATNLPEGSQLVIATREGVPSALRRLQSQGEVAALGVDVLGFDTDDATRLAESLGIPLDPVRLARIVDGAKGWPAAVYLALLSPLRPGMESASPLDGADGLADYFREQILGKLARDDADFLLQVSVLHLLDAGGCDALTKSSGSLHRLRRLASVNHLLAAQDEAGDIFRVHPLLARFLSRELRETDAPRWRAAHSVASVVAEQRGDLDGAVHHAKLSADDALLGRLIWGNAGNVLGKGQWAVVNRWLSGLDEQRLRRDCRLSLSAAWVASHRGDMARMSRLALAAGDRAQEAGPHCSAHVGLLRASIGSEGMGQIETASREFIRGEPSDDPWQTVAHYLLGVALFLRDQVEEGTAALDEGLRLAIAMDLPLMSAHCLGGLADVAIDAGNTHRALTCIRELRDLAAKYQFEAIATGAPFFTTSAVGYVLEGRYIDAQREVSRALRMTSMMGTVAPWHAVQGRLALAQVMLVLGKTDRAWLLVDEAGDARTSAAASPRLDRLYVQTRQRLADASVRVVADSALTTAEVRVLQYLPTHLSFPQIAAELFVSRHTVKTQAMSAYRKLGVHTRGEAITAARRAGLLP